MFHWFSHIQYSSTNQEITVSHYFYSRSRASTQKKKKKNQHLKRNSKNYCLIYERNITTSSPRSQKRKHKLPLHRYIDHKIPLKPDCRPPFGLLYSISFLELKVVSHNLKENLRKRFIWASLSSCGAPIQFVKKTNRRLQFCVDYRGQNKITVKNCYSLLLIQETMHRLRRAKIFIRLNLRGAYNLIIIKEGDGLKTAFRTHYGLFEYLVIPFDWTNTPATYQ